MALPARAMALLAALVACQALHKRAEMSPMPFVLGSRYGRSPDRLITPRNDRFFMGGRYGKRSEPPTTQREAPAVGSSLARQGAEQGAARGARERDRGPLICRYTGVLSLYSCARRAEPHARRLYQRTNGHPASASAALSEQQ